MPIFPGDKRISKAYRGNRRVLRGYLGQRLIFSWDEIPVRLQYILDNDQTTLGDTSGDLFGVSYAVDEQHILIGASYESLTNYGAYNGAVYLFDRTTKELLHTFRPPYVNDVTYDHEFGDCVGMAGNTIVIVGWANDNEGYATYYVYQRNTRTLRYTLEAPFVGAFRMTQEYIVNMWREDSEHVRCYVTNIETQDTTSVVIHTYNSTPEIVDWDVSGNMLVFDRNMYRLPDMLKISTLKYPESTADLSAVENFWQTYYRLLVNKTSLPILEYTDTDAFPVTGMEGYAYRSLSSGYLYFWNTQFNAYRLFRQAALDMLRNPAGPYARLGRMWDYADDNHTLFYTEYIDIVVFSTYKQYGSLYIKLRWTANDLTEHVTTERVGMYTTTEDKYSGFLYACDYIPPEGQYTVEDATLYDFYRRASVVGTTVATSGEKHVPSLGAPSLMYGEWRQLQTDIDTNVVYLHNIYGTLQRIIVDPVPTAGAGFGYRIALTPTHVMTSNYGYVLYVYTHAGVLVHTHETPNTHYIQAFQAIGAEVYAVGRYDDTMHCYNFEQGTLSIIENPNDFGYSSYNYFGEYVRLYDHYLVIYGSVKGIVDVYDVRTGVRLRRFTDTQEGDNGFAAGVAVYDDYIFISSLTRGVVECYTLEEGALLQTLTNPNTGYGLFGMSLEVTAEHIFVSACGDTTLPAALFVFTWNDAIPTQTFDLARMYTAPSAHSGSRSTFGETFVVADPYVVVADRACSADGDYAGAVYRYNYRVGSTAEEFVNPDVDLDPVWDEFGTGLALVGNKICIGAPGETQGENYFWGTVHIYDLVSKEFLRSINTPSVGETWTDPGNDYFGSRLAATGNYLLACGLPDTSNDDVYRIRIYLYDISTGVLETSFEIYDNINVGDVWGFIAPSFAGNNGWIAVGVGDLGDAHGEHAGKVLVYKR